MSQQRLNPVGELQTYQIRLIGEHGEIKFHYDTMCSDDDEAIDKVFALKDISYARFEIACDGQPILQGLRIK